MEWKEVTIKEITSVLGDGLHGTPRYDENGDYFFINGNNLSNGHIEIKNDTKRVNHEEFSKHKKELNNRTILVSINGTIGNVAKYNGEKCILGKSACYFNVKDGIDRDFVYYVVSSPIFIREIANQATGTTIKNVSLKQMREYKFMIPNLLDDQRRISSILSSLDRKIELNNKINATLEEMAQALFKSWFVDFEPFKNGNFIDTEIGKIPEGWRVEELSEVCMFDSGYSYKGAELQASSNAMATIKNFDRKGGFKIDGYKEIIVSPKVKPSQFVNLFDILVAHTDLTQNAEIVGNPAIVLHKGGYEQLIMSMDLVKVTSKAKELSFGLLYSILKSPAFKQHALGYVNGTTVLHMSKKALPEYVLALPNDLASIKGLSDTLDNIFKRIASNMQETLTLTHLRDTLLPRLMSGEIEV